MTKNVSENYIIEFYQAGNSVKVTAICPATGREAAIIVPSNIARMQMQKLAVQKLEYVKAKLDKS